MADGESYQLWASTAAGTWDQVSVPLAPEVGSERTLTVAGRGDDVLLLADDAAQGRVWLATLAVTCRRRHPYRGVGFEPTSPLGQWCLRPPRMPIPPTRLGSERLTERQLGPRTWQKSSQSLQFRP